MPIRGEHVAEPANSTAIPLIKDIFGVSADFLGQLRTWFEQNPPAIPVSQIIGFNQFAVNTAPAIATSETTSSTTYADLATVGPKLTGLSDGKYLFIFGAVAAPGGAATESWVSISGTGTAATDANGTRHSVNGSGIGITRAAALTLAGGGNNTATVKYRSSSGTSCTFLNRWMLAIRYANP